jgi:hypothetical protein
MQIHYGCRCYKFLLSVENLPGEPEISYSGFLPRLAYFPMYSNRFLEHACIRLTTNGHYP